MPRDLHRASAALFFLLGIAAIVLLILVKQGIGGTMASTALLSLDLPLLFSGMLFGGTSLYLSFAREGEFSFVAALAIGLPLLLLAALFAAADFLLPFAEV